MLRDTLILTLILICSLLVVSGNVESQTTTRASGLSTDAGAQVRILREKKDFAGLTALSLAVQQQWTAKDFHIGPRIMIDVSQALSSDRTPTFERLQTARLSLIAALNRETPLEVADTCEILLELRRVDRLLFSMHVADFPKMRLNDVELSLNGWKRLAQSQDRSWDPNDVPLLNVPLPPGISGEAGMPPAAIGDAKQRADYEAAVEANRDKADHYAAQHNLRLLGKRYFPAIERFVVEIYSKEPAAKDELKRILTDTIDDAAVRQRILDAVGRAAKVGPRATMPATMPPSRSGEPSTKPSE